MAMPAVPMKKRALEIQDYSEFQISDGVAGNALEEVSQMFPVEEFEADLAGVSDEDLEILKAARETAEEAETEEGGFNEAIEAAGGKDTEEGAALQVGKIKNKVLKLKLGALVLEIEQAKGDDVGDKLEDKLNKLNNNVETDRNSAGQASQGVDFQGSSDPANF